MASILVIDDEFDVRDILRLALEKEGYAVTVAANGTDAMNYLQRNHPDLVLLDVRMPDINGLELLPKIKALCGSPVIVITGIDDYRIADLLYEVGADGYLTKPFDLGVLSRTIAQLLDTCRAQSG